MPEPTKPYRSIGIAVKDGKPIYLDIHDSNADACQDLAERFTLSEPQHQALWDDLLLYLEDGTELVVGDYNDLTIAIKWEGI